MLLSMTQYGKVKNRQNKRDEERKNCVKHKNNLHVSERKKRGALTDQMSTKIAKDTAFINFTRLLFIIHLVKSNMCGSGMVKRIVRFIYFCQGFINFVKDSLTLLLHQITIGSVS